MRIAIALSLGFALAITSCKSAEKTGEAARADQTKQDPNAVRAQFGGQLVRVGAHTVEVRLFRNGLAEAVVVGAGGAAIADPSKVGLTLRANAKSSGSADARPAIQLAYDAPTARFTGKAAGAVELTPGPVDVELRVGDAMAVAKLESPVLLVGPELGGTLVVAGKYGVEVVARADGSAEALVRDAAGVSVTGDGAMKLELKLAARGNAALVPIKLAWDAPRARFVGRADAAAKLAGGAAEIYVDGALAAAPVLALSVEAKHGGRVIVAGAYSVEVVANGSAVSAFVFDASGAAVAKADLDLSLGVGGGAWVKLAWDPPSASFRADLREKLDFSVTPVTIALKADGKAFVGAMVPSVRVDANANVVAKAGVDAKADLKAKAEAKAPKLSAAADIKAPKVDVQKSANASAGTGAGAASAKAGAGFSFGTR